MARSKLPYPSPKELEVLQSLWDREPCSVRDVREVLSKRRERPYTSVLNLLNLMTEKGLLMRKQQGRAFLYKSRVSREKTLGGLAGDLLSRVFAGSTTELLRELLNQANPTAAELDGLKTVIEEYRRSQPVR